VFQEPVDECVEKCKKLADQDRKLAEPSAESARPMFYGVLYFSLTKMTAAASLSLGFT